MSNLLQLFSQSFRWLVLFFLGVTLLGFLAFILLFIYAGFVTPKSFPEKAKQTFLQHKAAFEELRQMISHEPFAYCISTDRGQLAIGPYFYTGKDWQLIGGRSNKRFSREQVYSLMRISQERFEKYCKLLKEIDFDSVNKNLISDEYLPFADQLQSSNSSIPNKIYLYRLVHAKPEQLIVSFRLSPRGLASYIDYIPNNQARPVRDCHWSEQESFEQLDNHWFLER
jgi:hypothetical protein